VRSDFLKILVLEFKNIRHVRLAQPPAYSIFLSEQTSHQQPPNSKTNQPPTTSQ
jgi:hypothetical protein